MPFSRTPPKMTGFDVSTIKLYNLSCTRSGLKIKWEKKVRGKNRFSHWRYFATGMQLYKTEVDTRRPGEKVWLHLKS